MESINGRIDGLPGRVRKELLEDADMCSRHPKRKSVWCIQGETDSFGAELVHMCLRCKGRWLMFKRDNPDGPRGYCDSCRSSDVPVLPWRDPEEGMAGPVYYQCVSCRKARHQREAEELAHLDDDRDLDPWDDPDNYEYPADGSLSEEYLLEVEPNHEPDAYLELPQDKVD